MPHDTRTKKLLLIGFVMTFLYGLQLSLTIYSFSDFLKIFLSEKYIGILYLIASALTLYVLNIYNKVINRYHNFKTTSTLLALNAFSLCMLAFSYNVYIITCYAILNIIFNALLAVSLNLYIEEWTEHHDVGMIRGTAITVTAISLISGLFLSKIFINMDIGLSHIFNHFNTTYGSLYLASTVILLSMLYLCRHYFEYVREPIYAGGHMWKVIGSLYRNRDLKGVFIANLMLNTYVAVMIYYFVIYMKDYTFVNMSDYIGIIMPIALLPFVFLPFTIGHLTDQKHNEKSLILLGVSIMIISLLFIPLMTWYTNIISLEAITHYQNINNFNLNSVLSVGNQSQVDNINHHLYTQIVMMWGVLLLFGRMGSSLVETAVSSYFYKKVNKSDNDMIALFTNTGPMGGILAAIFAMTAYYINAILSINYSLFIIVVIVLLFSLKYIKKIRRVE